jgi:hypothetical protein
MDKNLSSTSGEPEFVEQIPTSGSVPVSVADTVEFEGQDLANDHEILAVNIEKYCKLNMVSSK